MKIGAVNLEKHRKPLFILPVITARAIINILALPDLIFCARIWSTGGIYVDGATKKEPHSTDPERNLPVYPNGFASDGAVRKC